MSIMSTIMSLCGSIWSLGCLLLSEYTCHLSFLKDHENGKVSKKREFYISGDLDLSEMRQKTKTLGVGMNDYFLGAISVAVHKVTKGRELCNINIV